MEAIEAIPYPPRNIDAPLRAPIHLIYKISGIGTVVSTRLVSGTVKIGDSIVILPAGIQTEVKSMEIYHTGRQEVSPGDLVGIGLRGVSISDLSKGMLICHTRDVCPVSTTFVANIRILNHPNGVHVGYTPFCILSTTKFPVRLIEIRKLLDSKTGKVIQENPKTLLSNQSGVVVFQAPYPIALEEFKICPPLGRFVLRDLNMVIGVGIVSEILESQTETKLTYIGKNKKKKKK